jgi:hypothetical protein
MSREKAKRLSGYILNKKYRSPKKPAKFGMTPENGDLT